MSNVRTYRAGPYSVTFIGGRIAWGGAIGGLLAWGLVVILLFLDVLPPAPTYFIAPGHFLDLALQSSILNLLSFPGAFVFDPIAPWFPFMIMLVSAFMAGVIAQNPTRGLAAVGVLFFFIGIFLFLFMVIPLGFSVDLNLVFAFIGAQLASHWANYLGLLISIIPPLILGAIGGLVNRKKK